SEIDAEGDIKTGVKIVLKALAASLREIVENAGVRGTVIVEKLKTQEAGVGYNAATNEWVNIDEAGSIDPTKVTRSAWQKAGSAPRIFLTTEAVVADIPEENGGGAPDMGGMGGGMPAMR